MATLQRTEYKLVIHNNGLRTIWSMDFDDDRGDRTKKYFCFLKLPNPPKDQETIELEWLGKNYKRVEAVVIVSPGDYYKTLDVMVCNDDMLKN